MTRWPLVSWKQREDPVSGHSALSGDGQGAAAASSPGRGGRGAALHGETAAGQSSLSRVARPRLGTWAPTWLPSSEARIALTPQGGTPLSRWVLPPAVLLHLCPGWGAAPTCKCLGLASPGSWPSARFLLHSLRLVGQEPSSPGTAAPLPPSPAQSRPLFPDGLPRPWRPFPPPGSYCWVGLRCSKSAGEFIPFSP